MKAKGHVFKYGDNVYPDVIIPTRYLNSFDHPEYLKTWSINNTFPPFALNSEAKSTSVRSVK